MVDDSDESSYLKQKLIVIITNGRATCKNVHLVKRLQGCEFQSGGI